MSDGCAADGFNAEFVIVRGAPKQAGTVLEGSCELSQDKATDCPNL